MRYFYILPIYLSLDYLKSHPGFFDRVREDASTFRPLGTKIASYTRYGGSHNSSKGKGKTKASEKLDEDDEDAIVYEVYHVRINAFTGNGSFMTST